MDMKFAFAFALLALFAAPGLAHAQDANGTINESQVGAVPGDFFYGFKRLGEAMDVMFTFDQATKAEKEARYANLRVHEAYVLSVKAANYKAAGNQGAADQAESEMQGLLNEHASETAKAHADLEQAIASGDANETEIADVENHTRNSITVLQRVYEQAPEQAKDAILNALNNSIQNQERHEEKVAEQENRTRGNSDFGKGHQNETERNESLENGTSHGNETELENETGQGNESGDLNRTMEQNRTQERNETEFQNQTRDMNQTEAHNETQAGQQNESRGNSVNKGKED